MKRLSWAAAAAPLTFSLLLAAGCGGGGSDSRAPEASMPLPTRYVVSEVARVPFQATFVDANASGYVIGFNYVANVGRTYDDGFVVSPAGEVTLIPDPAGFPSTSVRDINANGQVVGTSNGSAGGYNGIGFVYDIRSKTLSTIVSPNSPVGINDSGKVVGTYSHYDPIGSVGPVLTLKGIVYDIASGDTLELPPDSTDNNFGIFQTTGINNSGLVVGDLNGDLAFYDLSSRKLKVIPPTGQFKDGSSFANSITDTGKVSGIDSDGRDFGVTRKYIYDVASGAKTYLPETMVLDGYGIKINASGTAIGGDYQHHYVYSGGQYQEIKNLLSPEDAAKWKIGRPFAINDSGVIYAPAELNGASEEESRTNTYLLRLTPQ